MENAEPEKPRKRRASGRGDPNMDGKRRRGYWQPELVGVVRGYPKTQETWQKRSDLMRQQIKLYNAEGITFRSGVPDGWAGKKALIKQINERAEAEADKVLEGLEADGRWVPDNLEAKVAMREAYKIMLAEKHTPEQAPVPLYSAKERLNAAALALKYVQRAPVTTSVVGEASAEDLLAALARKE